MKAGRHLFLDLEDTLITPLQADWCSFDFINVEKVKLFMAGWRPDTVNLFSFAVHDQADVSGFNRHVRPSLERDLGVSIKLVPTTDGDILPACCRQMKLHPKKVDFSEMSAFWSKHQGFRLFVKDLAGKGVDGGAVVALIDDAVVDERFEWKGLRVSGSIINIASIDETGTVQMNMGGKTCWS